MPGVCPYRPTACHAVQVREIERCLLNSVSDSHCFERGSGSCILGQYRSGSVSNSGTRVLMAKIDKNLQLKLIKNFKHFKTWNFFTFFCLWREFFPSGILPKAIRIRIRCTVFEIHLRTAIFCLVDSLYFPEFPAIYRIVTYRIPFLDLGEDSPWKRFKRKCLFGYSRKFDKNTKLRRRS
jgi:hypothetical protein